MCCGGSVGLCCGGGWCDVEVEVVGSAVEVEVEVEVFARGQQVTER